MAIKAITGFQDVLPDRARLFTRLEQAAAEVFARYGYREIRFPQMEFSELFSRSIGQTTDIVEKEMFSLTDSKGRSMSLRPEGTAGVVRAFIQSGLCNREPQARLSYSGAMFRHERPQKGRFRQFHQIGAEAFGSDDPLLDAEVIVMLMEVFEAVGVDDLRLEINSIGDEESRPRFRRALVDFFSGHKAELCKDCLRRLETNPMRILDCKVPSCRKIARDAPIMLGFLGPECQRHFSDVQKFIRAAGTDFVVNERIVRGLDYYTRTAFEVTTDKLGAQDAVAGGGRYDGLVELLGGPALPGVGFAIGVERVVELMGQAEAPARQDVAVMIVPIGEEAREFGVSFAGALRKEGASCQVGLEGRSVKALMRRADKLGARYVLVIGEDEINKGSVDVKDMGADRPRPKNLTEKRLGELFSEAVRNHRAKD